MLSNNSPSRAASLQRCKDAARISKAPSNVIFNLDIENGA